MYFGWKNNTLHADVVDILSENRFVWNTSEYIWQCNFSALKTYKKLNGNLLLRNDFVVPLNDPNWPKDTWGLNLGYVVGTLRMTKDKMKPDRRIELEKLGFVWDHVEYNYQRYLIALKTYKNSMETLFTHNAFVVPSNDPKWPEETWNLKIGAFVQRLRSRCEKLSPEYLQELDKLGFVWNVLKVEWKIKLTALKTYQMIHGNLSVPCEFVIPINDPNWPEEAWNLRLGKLRARRDNLSPEHRNDLDNLGFVWDELEYNWQCSLTALKTYQKIHGNLLIPNKFVVPTNDRQWPKDTWNIKLGLMVTNLRSNQSNLTPELRNALEKLGFV
ncbi:hypothetical protein THRCLA_21078 [Thraustotheca clavata]|uniref:Helicase-associated domain-containing protein n=1 Tax=Thraustotheca clavata TaxID=74557 RepID=A0A1W0A0G0_9STRA|nr:hypothetical protein THRCLA_21078 [Thraustotheca clavata]